MTTHAAWALWPQVADGSIRQGGPQPKAALRAAEGPVHAGPFWFQLYPIFKCSCLLDYKLLLFLHI